MTKVVICGALGRMGTTIAGLLQDADGLEFVGGVDIKGGESFGKPVVTAAEIDAFLERVQPDVMIDFTIASAAEEMILSMLSMNISWSLEASKFGVSTV